MGKTKLNLRASLKWRWSVTCDFQKRINTLLPRFERHCTSKMKDDNDILSEDLQETFGKKM